MKVETVTKDDIPGSRGMWVDIVDSIKEGEVKKITLDDGSNAGSAQCALRDAGKRHGKKLSIKVRKNVLWVFLAEQGTKS